MGRIKLGIVKATMVLGAITAGAISLAGCSTATDKLADVNGKDQLEILARVEGSIAKIIDGNGYVTVIDGEESSGTYIFNSNGEAISQDNTHGYVTIYKNDGSVVGFTEQVHTGEDMNVLEVLKTSLDLVRQGDAELRVPLHLDEDMEDLDIYYVNIDGIDNIRKLYTKVNEEHADFMVEQLIGAVGEEVDGKDLGMKFQFIVGDEGQFSAGSELVLGDGNYSLWYFDGYLLMYDWELGSAWYEYDFTDGVESDKILDGLMVRIGEMLARYAEENGLEPPVVDTEFEDEANIEYEPSKELGEDTSETEEVKE